MVVAGVDPQHKEHPMVVAGVDPQHKEHPMGRTTREKIQRAVDIAAIATKTNYVGPLIAVLTFVRYLPPKKKFTGQNI